MALSVKEEILVAHPELEKWSSALSKIVDSNIEDIDAADLKEYGIVDRAARKKCWNVIQKIIADDKGDALPGPPPSSSTLPPRGMQPRMRRAATISNLELGKMDNDLTDLEEMRAQFQMLKKQRYVPTVSVVPFCHPLYI